MRHAKSSWDHPGLDDHDRPLNERGRRAAQQMGRFLTRRELQPARLLVSSAVRAMETGNILMAEWNSPSMQILPELYHATPWKLRQILEQIPAHQTTLVIGHNPGMEELISDLAGDVIHFPTAAIASLSQRSESERFELATLQLEDVWRPKELP